MLLEEGVKVTKADENAVVSQFILQAESTSRAA